MSIVYLLCEKSLAGQPTWEVLQLDQQIGEASFSQWWYALLSLPLDKLSLGERVKYVQCLDHCFLSLEQPVVRQHCLKLVSLPLWLDVTSQAELVKRAGEGSGDTFSTLWKRTRKAYKDPAPHTQKHHHRFFIPTLMSNAVDLLEQGRDLPYVERVLELCVDLLSQLPTRRYFRAVVEDLHLGVRTAPLALSQLQGQLVKLVTFYTGFEVDDVTGQALTQPEVLSRHYALFRAVQRVCFEQFREQLAGVWGQNVGALDNGELLRKELIAQPECARKLCEAMFQYGGPRAVDVLVAKLTRRQSQLAVINEQPLIPNEDLLWDPFLVPEENYTGEHSLALPKLNLQFLTVHDYLLRNYNLFRLESAYEVRGDLEDSLRRLHGRTDPVTGQVKFGGSSRMALPLLVDNDGFCKGVEVLYPVSQPRVGERHPQEVRGEFTIDTRGMQEWQKKEWDGLREHDVVFLLAVQPPQGPHPKGWLGVEEVRQAYGVLYVRGAEVMEVVDSAGVRVSRPDYEAQQNEEAGLRRVRVKLDPAQYFQDTLAKIDPYPSLNVVVRRKPKENNFKAVLQTIRQLMNDSEQLVVPPWLHDLFLGYSSSAEAVGGVSDVHYGDTFIDHEHLAEGLPDCTLTIAGPPPYRLRYDGETCSATPIPSSTAFVPYPPPPPVQNTVRFTPTQLKAIRSGVGHGELNHTRNEWGRCAVTLVSSVVSGLTLIVGPPGTGKTDTAVQIVSLLYHNYPNEKILLVAHSNQALNDLFQKICDTCKIDERYLLRMGRGAEELDSVQDFSRWGRIRHMLRRRGELLERAGRLAEVLGLSAEDTAYSCANALQLYHGTVLPAWEGYLEDGARFPFQGFFPDVKADFTDPVVVQGCWAHVQGLFNDIKECEPFELLRSDKDRGEYLLTTQARVIAMTCTHAALARQTLVDLDFKYDSLIMEESAQILEVETFIPMLLQRADPVYGSRLKRVCLIGDHHQLPPVVKNRAFQKYGRLDQSLFTRFIRLQTPHVLLDMQGRARPSIAALFSWRYKALGDLPAVHGTEYLLANPGLTFDYQFIDVGQYQGQGETTPSPHYYQNRGEAEYVVSVFMYLRLIGYPACRITVVASYNGQKQLIRDVLAERCSWSPVFGKPYKVTTIDRYQGQQNDIVLVSLTRTEHIGHIRDIRRWVRG